MQPNLNINNANQILLELNKVPEKIDFDIIYHISGQKVKKNLLKCTKSHFIIVLAEKLTREHCRTESNIRNVVLNTSINIARENDLSGL